jgi:hypothetical protein
MRARLVAGAMVLGFFGCGGPTPSVEEPSGVSATSSGLTRHLYIFDQSGSCTGWVGSFFQCVLTNTNWNDLANTYPFGESLQWGGIVRGSGCGIWDAQCWTNKAGWHIQEWDVLLTIIPNSQPGGQNDTCSVNGTTVNCAYVRDGGGSCKWQTVYGGHEVFEEQTDGVSADCCDGETSSGGPFPWCAQCHPYPGVCGQYAANGTLGITTVSCGGNTYEYQMVSPGNHEFDGTCNRVSVKSNPNDPCSKAPSGGDFCGRDGLGGAADTLYTCSGAHGVTSSSQACKAGCKINPAGQNDVCYGDPCTTAPTSGGYCGGDGIGGDPAILYQCSGGATASFTRCANGCQPEPVGTADVCK